MYCVVAAEVLLMIARVSLHLYEIFDDEVSCALRGLTNTQHVWSFRRAHTSY